MFKIYLFAKNNFYTLLKDLSKVFMYQRVILGAMIDCTRRLHLTKAFALEGDIKKSLRIKKWKSSKSLLLKIPILENSIQIHKFYNEFWCNTLY